MSESTETVVQPTESPEVQQPVIEPIGMRSFRDMQSQIQEQPTAPPVTVIPETKEEPVAPEATKVPEVSVAPVTPEPTTPQNQPEFNKYKEWGIDESQQEDFEKYITAWKTGKIDEFVRVKNTDYDSMSTEELIRIDLKRENPTATSKQLDILHKQYLKSLGVTEFAEDVEREEGTELYNLRAEKVRDALKSEKSTYQLPEYKAPESTPQVDPQVLRQEMVQSVQADPNFQAFATNRMVTMGSGEESYTYEVPATVDMLSATVDADGLFRLLSDKDGKFDMGKWIKTVAYAANMDKVESALIDFGKSKAEKSNFEKLNNPKPETIPAQPAASDGIQVIGQRSYRDINGR